MKKEYSDPQVDIIDFSKEEVVTASDPGYDIPDEDDFIKG